MPAEFFLSILFRRIGDSPKETSFVGPVTVDLASSMLRFFAETISSDMFTDDPRPITPLFPTSPSPPAGE